MHDVPFGSPADLPVFMHKLREERHFAMDFWALTGSLSSREGGSLSDEEMLALIVESVAGGEIEGTGIDLRSTVTDLSNLLAGIDVPSPTEPVSFSTTPVPPPHTPPEPYRQATANVTARINPEPAPVSAAAGRGATGTTEPEATISAQFLDEALLRLELSSLELKLHLDSIDDRMKRIEPHLAELSSRLAPPTEAIRNPQQAPLIPPAPPPEEPTFARPQQSSRLFLHAEDPEPSPTTGHQDAQPLTIPLAGYSQPPSHRSAVVFALLVLLLAGGIVLQKTHGSSLRADITALLSRMHGASPPTSDANANPAPSAVPASNVENATNSAPPPAVSAPPAPPAQIHPSAPAQTSAATETTPHRRMPSHPAAATEQAETAAEEVPTSDGQAAVSVPPAVMEANLVISRVPAYPEAAKAEHIEGPVVMRATISKDGFVDHLHVIEGDRMLREAASEAVYKWRYRPYLLNDKPVEVATTITVDFKLHP